MILCLTPNPALDLSYTLQRIDLDASHRVDTGHAQAGGKGLNVARVLHHQGYATRSVLTAGGSSGAELLEELESAGLPFSAIAVSGATRRSMAFHAFSQQQSTIFNEAGHPLSSDEGEALLESFSAELAAAQAVAICGSWPPETTPEFFTQFVRRAVKSAWTVVDTSGALLLEAARAGAVLKPNHHELRQATGTTDVAQGVAKLLRLGAPEVYLSAGEHGLFHFSASAAGIAHAFLPTALPGNPTGAGDSAVAALTASALDGADREQSLRRAVSWSASTVLMPTAGATHPSHAELFEQVNYALLESVPDF
ncbi:1-phosphofructokinase family hexose kinase [Glutamicibacter endophyticus]